MVSTEHDPTCLRCARLLRAFVMPETHEEAGRRCWYCHRMTVTGGARTFGGTSRAPHARPQWFRGWVRRVRTSDDGSGDASCVRHHNHYVRLALEAGRQVACCRFRGAPANSATA